MVEHLADRLGADARLSSDPPNGDPLPEDPIADTRPLRDVAVHVWSILSQRSADRGQHLSPSSDFFDDCMRVSSPDEGLGVVVGFGEISIDGGLEINDALEHASLEPLLGQFAEEPFDGIEPGRRCRSEVEMEPRMPFEPSADLWMLMRRIIVHNEVQLPVGWSFSVDLIEKADELLMPMAACALTDDLAVHHVKRRQTASSCRGACSHASSSRIGRASSAAPAAFCRVPVSATSHRPTAPARARADLYRGRRYPELWRRSSDR